MRRPDATRRELLAEFDAAPEWALFPQEYVAAVRNCSVALIERERWARSGLPCVRDGKRCLYKKADVLLYVARLPAAKPAA